MAELENTAPSLNANVNLAHHHNSSRRHLIHCGAEPARVVVAAVYVRAFAIWPRCHGGRYVAILEWGAVVLEEHIWNRVRGLRSINGVRVHARSEQAEKHCCWH